MNRKERSAAVTRAATAAEIAANIAIRHELQEERKVEPEFVNHEQRNDVVHSGASVKEDEAKEVVDGAIGSRTINVVPLPVSVSKSSVPP